MRKSERLHVKGIDRQRDFGIVGESKTATLFVSRNDLIDCQFLNSLIEHAPGCCSMYSIIRLNGFSPFAVRQK